MPGNAFEEMCAAAHAHARAFAATPEARRFVATLRAQDKWNRYRVTVRRTLRLQRLQLRRQQRRANGQPVPAVRRVLCARRASGRRPIHIRRTSRPAARSPDPDSSDPPHPLLNSSPSARGRL